MFNSVDVRTSYTLLFFSFCYFLFLIYVRILLHTKETVPSANNLINFTHAGIKHTYISGL